jgi:rRNA maturation RNase YbeY
MLKRAGVWRAELSIVFVSGREIRALNRKYLGHDRVTDVIAFDLSLESRAKRSENKTRKIRTTASTALCSNRYAPCSIDGEIYICPAEARRNARSYGEPFKSELLRYLAHGILHLVGFDDATVARREQMRKLEDELLNA